MTRRTFLAVLAAWIFSFFGPFIERVWSALGPRNVLCLGDSLTYGYTVPGGSQQAANYPSLLKRLAPQLTVTNYGVSGRFMGPDDGGTQNPSPGTMINLMTVSSISPAITNVTDYFSGVTIPKVLVLFGGSNDIAQLHTRTTGSGYQTGGFTAICIAAKALGCRVIAINVPARLWGNNFNDCETDRVAFNTYTRSGTASAQYDVLIDLAAMTGFNDYLNLTYFQSDNTHFTPYANQIVAGLVRNAIGFGGSVFPQPGTVG